jgi:dTDP-4-amino-4,6-dideoxygalactose transaminase
MVDLGPLLRRAAKSARTYIAEMHAAGQYILGRQVSLFEEELASAFGARHAVGVGSGTSALEISLRAAHAGRPGAEVVVPALTSLFTAQAVLASGASLRIADIDPHTLLLTAETASQAITPQTSAVIAVHLYGRPCTLRPISSLCRLHSATLIQDACQAHGATHLGRPLSSFSPYVCYSFYPTKNLGCLGDGGAVLTRSASANRSLRLLRDGGRRGGQVASIPAVNSRLDELHACYLRAFLPHLAESNSHRRRIACLYRESLSGIPGVRLLPEDPESVHHLFVIRVRRRKALRQFLASHGIQTGVHYPVPLHLHPAFRSALPAGVSLPAAERACREILSLPIGPHIRPATALRIASLVRRFYQ